MANPFGDFDDQEDKTATSQDNNIPSLNPFGDDDEDNKQTTQLVSPIDETNPFKDDVEADARFGDISPIKPNNTRPSRSCTKLGDTSGFGLPSQASSLAKPDKETFLGAYLDEQEDSRSIASSTAGDNVSFFSLGDGSLQKEGLLCPDCLLEFKTITELMAHSESKHRGDGGAVGANAQASLSLFGATTSLEAGLSGQMSSQIRSLLSKLLKQGIDASNPTETLVEVAKVDDARGQHHNSMQDWKLYMLPGPKRSHFELFRSTREIKIEGHVFETNKLLIRLDRLLLNCPPSSDPIARREHEMSIVEWIDESIIALCPNCASRFNFLLLKKHHCRLCGSVMCSRCCEFIDAHFANRLLGPVDAGRAQNDSLSAFTATAGHIHASTAKQNTSVTSDTVSHANTAAVTMNAMFAVLASPLKAAMAEVGLGDANDSQHDCAEPGMDRIRLCLHCHSLLSIRLEKLEDAHCKSSIELVYAKLRDTLNEMNRLLPVYYKMVDSLYSGEHTYKLEDAKDLRDKLTKLSKVADAISRQIEHLDLDSAVPLPQRRLKIQQSIRRSTVFFLREYLVALPDLPDPETLEQLRARHAEIMAARIAYEKKMTLQQQNQANQVNNGGGRGNIVISLEDGFCLDKPVLLDASMAEMDDPIVLQMNIIKSYIQSARADHRYDEVSMLEKNLKELEIEFYFNQTNATTQANTSGFAFQPDDELCDRDQSLSPSSLQ